MKAITIVEPNRVEITDVPMAAPQPGEALLRVLYCGICGADVASFTGNQPFTTYPRIPGHEFSAQIVSIPENDRGLRPGDIVTCNPYFNLSLIHIYGERQEGLVWEASMAAAHYHLDNLTVIFDHNGLQIDGSNDQVMSLGDVGAKFAAFGYDIIEVKDGNDMSQVLEALHAPACPGKPRLIWLHTLKGKGVSFMEGQVGWHGKAPNAEQCAQALKDLEG